MVNGVKIQFPWASIDGDVNVVSLLEAALGIFSVVTRQLLVGCAVELLFFFSCFLSFLKIEKTKRVRMDVGQYAGAVAVDAAVEVTRRLWWSCEALALRGMS